MFSYFRLLKEILLLKKPKSEVISEKCFQNPVIFPLQNSELHRGFVNSLNNDWGLKANFFYGPDRKTFCTWDRTLDQYQGFSGIIHGGILTALADELMANCIVAHIKKFGVTLSSNFQWHRPVRIGETVYGKSEILATMKSFIYIKVILQNSNEQVVLSGYGLFYLPNEKQFKKITNINLPEELFSFIRK